VRGWSEVRAKPPRRNYYIITSILVLERASLRLESYECRDVMESLELLLKAIQERSEQKIDLFFAS
jgi:hypothetical protein